MNRKQAIATDNAEKNRTKDKKVDLVKQKEDLKKTILAGKKNVGQKKVYGVKHHTRHVESTENAEEAKEIEGEQPRAIDEYVRVVNKHTELFSFFDPETIMQTLIELSEE